MPQMSDASYVCPHCGRSEGNETTSSRVYFSGDRRRRRECSACGERFSTVETVDETSLFVDCESQEVFLRRWSEASKKERLAMMPTMSLLIDHGIKGLSEAQQAVQ